MTKAWVVRSVRSVRLRGPSGLPHDSQARRGESRSHLVAGAQVQLELVAWGELAEQRAATSAGLEAREQVTARPENPCDLRERLPEVDRRAVDQGVPRHDAREALVRKRHTP